MRTRLIAAVSAIAVLWGIAFVAIKELLAHLSPFTLVIARFAIADVILLAVMAATPGARPRFARADIWRLVVLGVTGVPMYHLALNFGEQHTSATIGALVIATAPVMVAAASALLLGERINAAKVAGIAIAFGGVALLAFGRHDASAGPTNLSGLGIEMLAPIAWAAYTIVAKPLLKRAEPLRVTATTVVIGSLIVFPFTRAATFHELAHLPGSGWAWLAILGVGSSATGYLLYIWALSHMEATKASVILYAVPIVGVFSAWLIRSEPLGWVVAASAALVIGGVALTQRPSREALIGIREIV